MNFKDTEYGDLTGKAYRGNITVPYNVTSLEGAPEEVWDFYVNGCEELKSLEYSPRNVKGSFKCIWCKIKNLKGAPEIVEGDFKCYRCNNLESVAGAPKKCKTFYCRNCPKLKNLDPLLLCDIEEVVADKELLEDYNRKKDVIQKYGYEEAMEIFKVMEEL